MDQERISRQRTFKISLAVDDSAVNLSEPLISQLLIHLTRVIPIPPQANFLPGK